MLINTLNFIMLSFTIPVKELSNIYTYSMCLWDLILVYAAYIVGWWWFLASINTSSALPTLRGCRNSFNLTTPFEHNLFRSSHLVVVVPVNTALICMLIRRPRSSGESCGWWTDGCRRLSANCQCSDSKMIYHELQTFSNETIFSLPFPLSKFCRH